MSTIPHKLKIQIGILLITGLAFYANSLRNQYALDDAIVITKNEFTTQGLSGIPGLLRYDSFTGFFGEEKNLVTGGRYRPLSLITFAIEYEFFGMSPFVSHLVNLIIYLLTVIIVFRFLSKFFEESDYFSFSFILSLLFLIHPVHTEVVTNIKGRDELMAFLFGMLALKYTVQYYQTNKIMNYFFAGLCLFLGLLSKENAIVFLALIPLFIYYHMPAQSMKRITRGTFPLIISAAVFIWIRARVLGEINYVSNELMNNPFVMATASQKAGTILYTLGMYIKLLFFPHPLTYDYYPYHIPLIDFFSWIPLLILAGYLLLVAFGLRTLKTRSTLGYAIWFYLFPLLIVANIFFTVGTFMNERFIYFSSFGFCWVLSVYLSKIGVFGKFNVLKIGLLSVLIFFSGIKTISRNKVWYNDFTLFTHDVQISEGSAKSNLTAGGALYERSLVENDKTIKDSLLDRSIDYLKKSLKIHPKYSDAYLLAGNAMWERFENPDSVIFYYKTLFNLSPDNQDAIANIKAMAAKTKNSAVKKQLYLFLHAVKPDDFDCCYALGNLYGKHFMEIDSALFYLEKALQLSPENLDALLDMGVASGMKGDYEQSLAYFFRALKQDPNNKQILTNIGVTYQRMGDMKMASTYFEKINTPE